MTIKKTVSIGPPKMKLLSNSLSQKRLLVFHGEIAHLDGLTSKKEYYWSSENKA